MKRGSPVSDNEKKKKRIESMKKDLSLRAGRLIQNLGISIRNNYDEREFKSKSMPEDSGKFWNYDAYRRGYNMSFGEVKTWVNKLQLTEPMQVGSGFN